MNILWLCHYFAPEIGAPQARLLETSRVWLRAGHQVSAVTCFPNHPTGRLDVGDRGRWYRRDDVDGVQVHRCWSLVAPNRGVLRKTLGHLSFMLTALYGLRRARRRQRPDVVIVSSPTFFSVFTAWIWCSLHRVPWIFEVRDLWPAVFVDLGVLRNRFVIATLRWWEEFLYRRADLVVTVTESFAEDIAARAVPRGKIAVITNGVDAERFSPGPACQALAERAGVDGKFVVLYLGAHGISHALGRVLELAERVVDLERVHFVFVGEGAEKESLRRRAGELELPNVSFFDGVEKDQVLSWYRLAQVGLVPLRDVQLFRTFIPSKMFEQMACGLPVLASVDGEAAEILGRSGGALVTAPEAVEEMEQALRRLWAEPDLRRDLARSGREFVLAHYTRTTLAQRYEVALRGLVSDGPGDAGEREA